MSLKSQNNICIVCIYLSLHYITDIILCIIFLLDEDIKKETLTKIMSARKKVQEHTVMYNERLKKLREAINKYSDEICALQSQCCSSSLD